MKTAFAQVRWAALGALLLAGAGVAVALYGIDRHRTVEIGVAQVKAQSLDTRQRLGSVYGERLEIDAFLTRYNTLQSIGALGNENRLAWIERLAAIRDQLRLPRLVYSVAARQANPGLPEPAPGLRFESSGMKLDFGLVHEGDLLQILARLRTPPMGVFEVRNCSLQRAAAGSAASLGDTADTLAASANLRGECQLDWTTLTGVRAPVEATPPAGAAKPS